MKSTVAPEFYFAPSVSGKDASLNEGRVVGRRKWWPIARGFPS